MSSQKIVNLNIITNNTLSLDNNLRHLGQLLKQKYQVVTRLTPIKSTIYILLPINLT